MDFRQVVSKDVNQIQPAQDMVHGGLLRTWSKISGVQKEGNLLAVLVNYEVFNKGPLSRSYLMMIKAEEKHRYLHTAHSKQTKETRCT